MAVAPDSSAGGAGLPPPPLGGGQLRARARLLERWLEEERCAAAEAEEAEAKLVFALDRTRFEAEQSGQYWPEDAVLLEADPWDHRWRRQEAEAVGPELQQIRAELDERRQIAALTLARLRSQQVLTAICSTDGQRAVASQRGDESSTAPPTANFPCAEMALAAELKMSLAPLLPLLQGSACGPGTVSGGGCGSSERAEVASNQESESRFLLTVAKPCIEASSVATRMIGTSSSIGEAAASQDLQAHGRRQPESPWLESGVAGASCLGAGGNALAASEEEVVALRHELADMYEELARGVATERELVALRSRWKRLEAEHEALQAEHLSLSSAHRADATATAIA